MKFRQAAFRLIIAAGFITAGFLLPLPDVKLPDIPLQPEAEIRPTPPPSSKTRQEFSPEDLSRLFEVRPIPARPRNQKPPEEQSRETSLSEPASPLPPLPPLRYVGEAVIRGRPVFYLMAGRPERLLGITEESEGDYRLISTTEEELILEFGKRSLYVPKK